MAEGVDRLVTVVKMSRRAKRRAVAAAALGGAAFAARHPRGPGGQFASKPEPPSMAGVRSRNTATQGAPPQGRKVTSRPPSVSSETPVQIRQKPKPASKPASKRPVPPGATAQENAEAHYARRAAEVRARQKLQREFPNAEIPRRPNSGTLGRTVKPKTKRPGGEQSRRSAAAEDRLRRAMGR